MVFGPEFGWVATGESVGVPVPVSVLVGDSVPVAVADPAALDVPGAVDVPVAVLEPVPVAVDVPVAVLVPVAVAVLVPVAVAVLVPLAVVASGTGVVGRSPGSVCVWVGVAATVWVIVVAGAAGSPPPQAGTTGIRQSPIRMGDRFFCMGSSRWLLQPWGERLR
jgi:hypothetical protein